MTGKYDDIINLPHWEPQQHPRMAALDRAGQFAPFAALTGYDSMVAEKARLTDSRIELDEEQRLSLDQSLACIVERLADHPVLKIVHFVQDSRKKGGRYVTTEGRVQNLELHKRRIILKGGKSLLLDDILQMEILD